MKLTVKHFKKFKDCTLRWAGKLAPEYKLFFEWQDSDTDFATIKFKKNGAVATLMLSREWPEAVTDDQLNQTAFHEIMHLVLSRTNLEMNAFYSDFYITELEHEIIRKIENLYFKEER